MAEWKYDPLDRDDENGEDDESTSSVSLYVNNDLILYSVTVVI